MALTETLEVHSTSMESPNPQMLGQMGPPVMPGMPSLYPPNTGTVIFKAADGHKFMRPVPHEHISQGKYIPGSKVQLTIE